MRWRTRQRSGFPSDPCWLFKETDAYRASGQITATPENVSPRIRKTVAVMVTAIAKVVPSGGSVTGRCDGRGQVVSREATTPPGRSGAGRSSRYPVCRAPAERWRRCSRPCRGDVRKDQYFSGQPELLDALKAGPCGGRTVGVHQGTGGSCRQSQRSGSSRLPPGGRRSPAGPCTTQTPAR